MDSSLPGSSVCGISQARILEWVAMSFSKGSFWTRDRTCVSCISRWIFLPLSHLKIYFLPSCKNHSKRIYSKILKMKKIKILTMDFFFFLSSLSLVHIVLFLKMSLILLCMWHLYFFSLWGPWFLSYYTHYLWYRSISQREDCKPMYSPNHGGRMLSMNN